MVVDAAPPASARRPGCVSPPSRRTAPPQLERMTLNETKALVHAHRRVSYWPGCVGRVSSPRARISSITRRSTCAHSPGRGHRDGCTPRSLRHTPEPASVDPPWPAACPPQRCRKILPVRWFAGETVRVRSTRPVHHRINVGRVQPSQLFVLGESRSAESHVRSHTIWVRRPPRTRVQPAGGLGFSVQNKHHHTGRSRQVAQCIIVLRRLIGDSTQRSDRSGIASRPIIGDRQLTMFRSQRIPDGVIENMRFPTEMR